MGALDAVAISFRRRLGQFAPLVIRGTDHDLDGPVADAFAQFCRTPAALRAAQDATAAGTERPGDELIGIVWDAFVAHSRGLVQVRPPRCSRCRGRGYDINGYARTGSPVCASCHGSGRGSLTSVQISPFPPRRRATATS